MVPSTDLLRVRPSEQSKETEIIPPAIAGPDADPISFLLTVVRKQIVSSGLSSLTVDITVVEILDAAHESAERESVIDFKAN